MASEGLQDCRYKRSKYVVAEDVIFQDSRLLMILEFDRHFRVPGGDVPSSDEDEPMPGSGAHSRKRSRDEVPGAEVPNAKKQKK